MVDKLFFPMQLCPMRTGGNQHLTSFSKCFLFQAPIIFAIVYVSVTMFLVIFTFVGAPRESCKSVALFLPRLFCHASCFVRNHFDIYMCSFYHLCSRKQTHVNDGFIEFCCWHLLNETDCHTEVNDCLLFLSESHVRNDLSHPKSM